MKFYKTPSLVQKVFPSVAWRVATDQPQLYLTFDDGPTPEVTPWVLDLLKQYHAKATFFCLAKNIEKERKIFERINAEGHFIGNHSYDHPKGKNCSTKMYLENIERANQVIQSKLFRPPYGSLSIGQYRALKGVYKIVLWDLLSYDFEPGLKIEESMEKLKSKAKAGSIIVFHDSHKAFPQLKKMLPELLAHWSKAYTFAALKAEKL